MHWTYLFLAFYHLFYLSLSPELEILLAWFTYIRTIGFHLSILSLAHTCHTRTPPKPFFHVMCTWCVYSSQHYPHNCPSTPAHSRVGEEQRKSKSKTTHGWDSQFNRWKEEGGGGKQQKTNKQQKNPNKANEIAHCLPQADQSSASVWLATTFKSNYLLLFLFTYLNFYGWPRCHMV